MSLGKVLLGVGIGVGAIAAAPFTGGGSIIGAATLAGSLAGAGTIATAAGAGVAGATVGALASKKSKTDIEQAKKEGIKEGKAENALEIEQLTEKILKASKALNDAKRMEDYTIAMLAVGVSVAHCDGVLAPEEEEAIDEFITGQLSASFSESLKTRISYLKEKPPSFNTAMKLVEKMDKKDWDIIDEIIVITIHADYKIKPEEEAYLEAWKKYKSA